MTVTSDSADLNQFRLVTCQTSVSYVDIIDTRRASRASATAASEASTRDKTTPHGGPEVGHLAAEVHR